MARWFPAKIVKSPNSFGERGFCRVGTSATRTFIGVAITKQPRHASATPLAQHSKLKLFIHDLRIYYLISAE